MEAEGQRVVFWDFDGTLAYREGLFRWELIKLLDEHVPGHGATAEDLIPHLNFRFPWHNPYEPHPGLSTPEVWWSGIEAAFAKAFAAVGVDVNFTRKLAWLAHQRYIDPQSFKLYDDTLPALEYLRERGWQNVILSNHVPELSQIVESIGLDNFITRCISSAQVGYEKPNPAIFQIALELTNNPQVAWMVGDRIDADVRGAEAVGINSILVRGGQGRDQVTHYADTVYEAALIIHPEKR